ncbi:MAG: hypothetical protein IPK33_22120 [Gemmatimonadetes bacterium]|nr:hypothetical protein [Gemmatimonadota bacterium]
MSWQQRTVAPTRAEPPKVDIRFPCPALSRGAFLVAFLVVGLGVVYGGGSWLGVAPINLLQPEWTRTHMLLVGAGLLLGTIAGFIAAAFAMLIPVRSEPFNDFLITEWQFGANTSLAWFMAIGAAVSWSLGSERAKLLVIEMGAERQAMAVIGAGLCVGLVIGAAFFAAVVFRLSPVACALIACAIALPVSRWELLRYGVTGWQWIAVGIAVPVITLGVSPAMIERDRRQRRVIMEDSR